MSVRSHILSGSVSGLTPKYVRIILHDPCVYCGGKMGSIDHIVPKSKKRQLTTGYSPDHWTNLTPACKTCNLRKGAKGLLRYLIDSLQKG